jgi:hypothetical protein
LLLTNARIPFVAAPVLMFSYGVIRILDGLAGVAIAVGMLADDHAGMAEIGRSIGRNPAVALAIYDVGPYLFYDGRFVLAVLRRIAGWTPLLLLVDLVMPLCAAGQCATGHVRPSLWVASRLSELDRPPIGITARDSRHERMVSRCGGVSRGRSLLVGRGVGGCDQSLDAGVHGLPSEVGHHAAGGLGAGRCRW